MSAPSIRTGLSSSVTQSLRDAIAPFKQVRTVYLFGSRARGDWTPRSDIDVAIDAPGMNASEFAQLWNVVDALPIVFPLDCVWLQALESAPLKTMIQRDGVVL